jgi:hypothetical protein
MRKCTADQIDSSWATRGSVQEGHVHARLLSGLLLHIIGESCPFSLATHHQFILLGENNPTKQAIVYPAGRWFRDMPINIKGTF